MPALHEYDNKWIYEAINDNKFKFDPVPGIYKYSNPTFPNKNYKKTFDPSFMERGDVINFGGSYRNENKMIFNGRKLVDLYTESDDYGSVPPEFVCGDNDNEFNIGDFEDLICHNSINWLSDEKINEIKLCEKNNKIIGNVTIKDKNWTICFDLYSMTTTEFVIGWWGSRLFKCIIEDNAIIINSNNKYAIKCNNDDDCNMLKTLINNDPNVSFISYYPTKQDEIQTGWFAFRRDNEFKLLNDHNLNLFNDMKNKNNINSNDFNINISKFPIIWKETTKNNVSETLIRNQENFNFYMKNHILDLNNIYINDITGYHVKIELIEQNNTEKLNYIAKHLNSKIPFNREGENILQVYF